MPEILTLEQVAAIRAKYVPQEQHGHYGLRALLLEVVESHEALRQLVEALAGSLRDFGATQEERRGSMYQRAAEVLDVVDRVLPNITPR